MTMTSQFADMTSSSIIIFLILTLPCFSCQVWLQVQVSFPYHYRLSFPNIWRLGDWRRLRVLNLARMFLIESYRMLQNAKVTAFTASNLSKKFICRWMMHHYCYFAQNLVVNYHLVLSYPQQRRIGINVDYWYVIIIAIHKMLLLTFSRTELWIICISY